MNTVNDHKIKKNNSHLGLNRGINSHMSQDASFTGGKDSNLSKNSDSNQLLQLYSQCLVCQRFCSRNYISSQLFEYSKARFFEQFFYNDRLVLKDGIFGCGHGTHPLRHYALVFETGTCKILFRYSPIDVYQIQYIGPKSFSSKHSLRALVEKKKNKLQDILELALHDFKLFQVKMLQKQIDKTILGLGLETEKYQDN